MVWNCKTCASDLLLELFAIFESVTALIVKVKRNKKRRRKIFMGPCTISQYIYIRRRVFIFKSCVTRTNFLQTLVFFGSLFGRFAILGHVTATKQKGQSETTKQHVPQLITKSPTKGCLQVMICYVL